MNYSALKLFCFFAAMFTEICHMLSSLTINILHTFLGNKDKCMLFKTKHALIWFQTLILKSVFNKMGRKSHSIICMFLCIINDNWAALICLIYNHVCNEFLSYFKHYLNCQAGLLFKASTPLHEGGRFEYCYSIIESVS